MKWQKRFPIKRVFSFRKRFSKRFRLANEMATTVSDLTRFTFRKRLSNQQ